MRKLPLLICLLGITFCTLTPEALAAPGDRLPDVEKLARVLHFLFFLMAVSIGSVAIFLMNGLWKPADVRRGSHELRNRPLPCLIAGLLVLLVLGGLIAIATNLGEPAQGLLAILALLPALYLAIRGGSILAYDLGDRLLASLNSRFLGSVGASILVGGMTLALAGLVPFVGQFVQALLFVLAAGAVLTGRSAARRQQPDANSTPETT